MSDSPTHHVSLKELAARLARGDEAAFAELYDDCADRLHGYLAARLGSRDAASDVLQNVFLRVVKSRRRFRGVENPIAYMFQVARNEAARAAAQRNRRHVPQTESLANVVDRAIDGADNEEMAAAALARLDGDDRELVELKVFAGLTFREIAVVVDRPAATVATRYRRALESLRHWLTEQYR